MSFARDVGLVDGDLRMTRPKKEIRTLENVQQWLGDLTMQYLERKSASLKQIEQAILDLSQNSPSRLPTQENIRAKLENPPTPRNFRLALRIVELKNITRNGPRDLLRTLDVAFQKSSTGKIGKSELGKARERAAQDSLDELTSAYNSLYPQLGDVVSAVFRDSETRSFTIKELRSQILTLMVNDHDMKALSKLKWLQSRSSQTLPEIFFETGVVALESGGTLTLPYEEDYTLDQFRKAESIQLVPALIAAIAA